MDEYDKSQTQMNEGNDQFYSRLPANHIPLIELLAEDHLFYRVPTDWCVIVTDIKNSTSAVANGLHETVNLVATGSIVSVLNVAYKANIMGPFFFGGDGATFIVPQLIIQPVMHCLFLFKDNTHSNFKLDLRIGMVEMEKIYADGYDLRISKFKSSEMLFIPIVLGDGLSYAEKLVKGEDYMYSSGNESDTNLDLTGMQCRWDKIAPPQTGHEVVTLLAIAAKGAEQSKVFGKVMGLIDDIYGTPQNRQPISVSRLKQKTTFARMELELRAKLNKFWVFGAVQTIYNWLLGYWYFQTVNGKEYLNRLVKMSDTLVIDGRINTVISGSALQRRSLEHALDNLEKSGEILYGLHVSGESVMSCYVRDLEDGHIHFVDGSEGGYTKAAGILKGKLRRGGL